MPPDPSKGTTPNRDAGYADAIRDVVEALRDEASWDRPAGKVEARLVLATSADFIEQRFGSSPETPEVDPLAGLPPDLAAVLRDQSVVVPQDGAVFALIAEWMNAKSDTPSALPGKYRGLAGKLEGEERKLKPWPDEERAAELKERADRFLAETPEGADEQRCDLCGGPVRAVTGGEGTSYYVPLGADREKVAEAIYAEGPKWQDAEPGYDAGSGLEIERGRFLDWRDLDESERDVFRDLADAALAAIEAQREESK